MSATAVFGAEPYKKILQKIKSTVVHTSKDPYVAVGPTRLLQRHLNLRRAHGGRGRAV